MSYTEEAELRRGIFWIVDIEILELIIVSGRCEIIGQLFIPIPCELFPKKQYGL